jgi:hypothetical protein
VGGGVSCVSSGRPDRDDIGIVGGVGGAEALGRCDDSGALSGGWGSREEGAGVRLDWTAGVREDGTAAGARLDWAIGVRARGGP